MPTSRRHTSVAHRLLPFALACCTLPAFAGTSDPVAELPLLPSASLPDSPGAVLGSAGSTADASFSSSSTTADPGNPPDRTRQTRILPMASRTTKFIEPGQPAPSLTSGNKVRLGLRAAFSPFPAFGWITAATYSHAVDSSPNYGQGWGPYGQRLGAAAIRGTTEGLFSDSVFAPLYHQDPRYYRLGSGHSAIQRTVYAVTRAVITRADDGHTAPNFALLSGNAAGAILTNAYYPDINRNAKTTAETFAGSIGGSALGFFIREFIPDIQTRYARKSH